MANEPTAKVALPSSRRGAKGFFAETSRELRKVNWPSPRDTTRLTGIVLTVCVGLAMVLLIMSSLFDKVITLLESGKIS
ncbi:MAG TPA: preprotein translocase subunit SecE [Fimbriimonadaceae bacterium]|nr:preprotein translocase subunit SecE [Fimbriimonadaceae bacterium]